MVAFLGTTRNTALDAPSGTTQVADSWSSGTAVASAAFDEILSPAGATGSLTTPNASWTNWVAQLVALKPAFPTATGASASFVQDALGAVDAAAPLTLSPITGGQLSIEDGGKLSFSRGSGSFTLELRGGGAAGWSSHAEGAARPTTFGGDAVTVDQGLAEQFLTVQTHRGQHHWSWDLATNGLTPALEADNSVSLTSSGGTRQFTIQPVHVYDAQGGDITPAGTAWTLTQNGSGWRLGLDLDDTALPLPYVIDPAITYDSATSAAGAAVTTLSWSHTVASQSDRMLVVGVTTESTSSSTSCQISTGYPKYNGVAMTKIDSTATTTASTYECAALYYLAAPATGTHTVQVNFAASLDATAGAVSLYGVKQAAPDASNSSYSNSGATSTSVTTTSSNAWVVDVFGSGQSLGDLSSSQTNRWTKDAGSSSSAGMSTQTVTSPGSRTMSWSQTGINRSAQVAAAFSSSTDTTPPSNTLSLSESSAYEYVSGSTLYYNPSSGNSANFTVTSSAADSDSGISEVAFPALLDSAGAADTSSPYSNTYSWTSSSAAPGGLLAQYYDNMDFTGTEIVRTDSTVDFNWGNAAPDASIAADTYTTRWTGQVVPLYSQTYTFYTQSDDGVRLWVNDQLVVDNWTDHGSVENSGTIALTAGQKYPIKMEYYENGGSAVAQLSWSSSSQAKQIIPSSQLIPTTVTAVNGAALVTQAAFSLVSDTTAPTGQSVALSGGPVYTTQSVPLTVNWGSDASSGLDASTEIVQRASATYNGSTCGTFGSFATVTLVGGADTTVAYGNCYRYRLVVKDRVGNQATSSNSADAKVQTPDSTPPTVSITAPTDGSTISGTAAVSATAADASGIQSVEFRFCAGWTCTYAAGTTIGTDTSSPYSLNLDSTLAPNGTYTIIARATDNFGNTTDSSPVTIVVANAGGGSSAVSVGTPASSSVASGTTLSWSFTVDAAANRVLVVGVTNESAYNVDCAITSVTFGGTALTKVADTATGGQSSTINRDCTSLWYLPSPATGTATITVTATNANAYGIIGGAVELSGVRSTTPDVTNYNSSESGLTSTSVTTTNADSLVIDVMGSGHASGDLSAAGGQTQLFGVQTANQVEGGMSTKAVASPGSTTMSWTQSSPNRSGQVLAVWSALHDSTPPTSTLSFGEGTNPGGQYEASTGAHAWTYYYNPASTGTFTMTDAAADPGSGVAMVEFPSLSTTGFTGTGLQKTSAPYTSNTYTFTTGNTTAPQAQTVNVFDNAGNLTQETVTFARDTTAPTASAALTGGPWYTTLSVPLTLSSSDSQSGVATTAVQRDSATLSNGSCGTFSGSWSSVTLTGGADTTVTSGNCYRYRYVATDNVGNQATSTQTADAEVDSSAPATPALTVTETSPLSYLSGSTLYYNAQGSNTASFDVAATTSDAQSGVQKITFPAVSGMTGGGDDTSSPYSTTYTWTSSTSASGTQTVTAMNGAGGTATATFTVTKDSTAPTGQTVALTGGPWYTALSIPLTIGWGSDAGSGLDSSTQTVERDSAALSNGSCGTFSGSWTPVTLVGGADITVQSGTCYRYRVHVSDNVGNTSANSTASADARVDTTAPTAPGLSYSATSNVYASGNTLYYRAGTAGGFTVTAASTDTESGVSYSFPTLPAGWTASGTGTTRTYTYTANPTAPTGNQNVTATNGAGLTATTTDHLHPRHHRTHRTDGCTVRRPLVHHPLRPADARKRQRLRIGPGHDERRRPARLGHTLERIVRNVRLLLDHHPGRRRRHHRPDRHLLPLPVPDLRQGRQPERGLDRERGRQDRHHRPDRPRPLLLRHLQRLRQRQHPLLPGEHRRQLHRHRHLHRRTVGSLVQLPDPPRRLVDVGHRRVAHVLLHRQPDRTDRQPERHRHQRRRPHRHHPDHLHRRHHRPHRPDRQPLRRPLVHHPLRPADDRLGLGRRLRHRQRHKGRRARLRHALRTGRAARSAARGRPSLWPAAPTPPSRPVTATATASASRTTSATRARTRRRPPTRRSTPPPRALRRSTTPHSAP